MRLILNTLLILVLLPGLCKAQQKNGVVFSTTEWDFGRIQAEAGPVVYDFKMKNLGNETVTIGNLDPSCSCVIAKMTDKVLSPGEEGVVQFILNPSGGDGQTYRTVDVYDTKGVHIALLGVYAEIYSSSYDLGQHYPIMLDRNLLANREILTFGYVHWGEEEERVIGIVNPSSEDIQLEVSLEGPLDSPLNVDYPRTLRAGEKADVVVKCSVPVDYGKFSSYDNVLVFIVNGQPLKKSIKTNSVVMKEIPKAAAAPSFMTYPSVAKMEKGFFSREYSGEIELSNKGKAPLNILGVKSDAETNIKAGDVVKPGQSITVEAVSDRPSARIEIFTDDPARPYKELIYNNQ